jgi:hypothetical protein
METGEVKVFVGSSSLVRDAVLYMGGILDV